MDSKTFASLTEEFRAHESGITEVKRGEYASDQDVLSNFYEVASWLGVSPEEYCLTLTFKHMNSILHSVRRGGYDWGWASDVGEGLKQRISDARNYLLLLAAILDEKRGEIEHGEVLAEGRSFILSKQEDDGEI